MQEFEGYLSSLSFWERLVPESIDSKNEMLPKECRCRLRPTLTLGQYLYMEVLGITVVSASGAFA